MVFILLFTACSGYAQRSDGDEGNPAVDVLLGAGISNEGLAYGGAVEMNIFGITMGARASMHGGPAGFSRHEVKEIGILAGYGCMGERYSLSVSGGYSFTSYKCTGTDSYACMTYPKGNNWGPTGQVKLVAKLSERTGLGLLGFGNFNKREDIYGAMLMLAIVM
jgi:hypothetical protein